MTDATCVRVPDDLLQMLPEPVRAALLDQIKAAVEMSGGEAEVVRDLCRPDWIVRRKQE